MTTHWNGTPYVRLYALFKVDHPDIWFVDAALAWWVRLLDLAEPAWPAAAPLPGDVPVEVLELLVDEGLIETVAGGRLYRISPLDAERDDRSGGKARGGRARAEAAKRDELGRMLPADADEPASEPASASITSIEPASDASIASRKELDVSWRASNPATPASRASQPASRPRQPAELAGTGSRAREDAAPPVRRVFAATFDPTTIRCSDYRGHSTQLVDDKPAHYQIAGVGWRCRICDTAETAADPLTFREKVDRAATRQLELDPDDRPF